MTLKFNIPRQEEYSGWGNNWRKHNVRVVPDSTWRLIMAVLKSVEGGWSGANEMHRLRMHLAKKTSAERMQRQRIKKRATPTVDAGK